jgi:hypothetical protein
MPVGDGFIEADVIRWKEPVFKNRRRGRPLQLGERLVTAEVLRDDGASGWVDLLVRHSEAGSARWGSNLSDLQLPPVGAATKRRRRTILRGNPDRLAWSDESARASVVASRFPGDRNPAPPVPAGTPEKRSLAPLFNSVSMTTQENPDNPGLGSPGHTSGRSGCNGGDSGF